ncbi:hypothetical protein HK100_006963 [Physocladia obscura]|uniref:Prenyltransferase alpha-alpha toroid domain-containing protein n=1 Tax=Physocladia obscura TaxID=109957 RepID=A0AAD5SPW2_9FUNG|nr:hypothetical protein HK100_006963 [Physocladia obscura]
MNNRWGINNDGYPTETSKIQVETEDSVFNLLAEWQGPSSNERLTLSRKAHIRFLRTALIGLGRNFVSLDASKPWILFWILQALDLLGEKLTTDEEQRAIDTLSRCQDDAGGFGGGPGQIAHLATTYAAVHALAIIGSFEAFDSIDRAKLYNWILSLKQLNGSFIMHHGGEVDVR